LGKQKDKTQKLPPQAIKNSRSIIRLPINPINLSALAIKAHQPRSQYWHGHIKARSNGSAALVPILRDWDPFCFFLGKQKDKCIKAPQPLFSFAVRNRF
jgi:hypothetical protein